MKNVKPYTPEEAAEIGFDGNFDDDRVFATFELLEQEQEKRKKKQAENRNSDNRSV